MPSIEPRVEGHALHRLEHQRVQVEHAELAVADPGLALAQALERADVDEHRAGAAELHVVRRRVLQDHVLLQRRQQQVELAQRRVLEHREGPLVRVRDERDALVAQDAGGLVDEHAAIDGSVLDLLGAHDPLVVEQAGAAQRHEVGQTVRRERAVDVVARVEDAALGVAERARLESCGLRGGVRGRGHGAGHSRRRLRARPSRPLAPSHRTAQYRLAGRSAQARLLAAGRLRLRGLRLVLLDVEEAQEAVPVQLGRYGDSSKPTRDDLQDHAPAAGIQISENGGHRERDSKVFRGRVEESAG
jgi:hypothetical protein